MTRICSSFCPGIIRLSRPTAVWFWCKEQPLVNATRTFVLFLIFCLFLAAPGHAERYRLITGNEAIVGQPTIVSTRDEDTFLDLARKFDLGFQELVLANPAVDPWLPGQGTQIVLPTQYILPVRNREGIVLNLAEMRLYYFPENSDGTRDHVYTYPISVGRQGWDTPQARTRVVRKMKDPTWYPPESIRKEQEQLGRVLEESVPPGPDNPLGKHALYMALPGYVIHGTNEPRGIGMKVTHGCIRLHPDDIEDLFNRVPLNTPVTIVNQPHKVAWHQGKLYAEMHPDDGGLMGLNDLTQFVRAVIDVTQSSQDYTVDWDLVSRLAEHRSGLPSVVGERQ